MDIDLFSHHLSLRLLIYISLIHDPWYSLSILSITALLQTEQYTEQAENNGRGPHPRIAALIYPRVMIKPVSRFYSMKDSCQA